MANGNWHLFIDGHIVARETGFDRVVHHPRELGVVIPADKPWETAGVSVNYIGRRDDGSFFGYCNGMWWDRDAGKLIESPGFRDDPRHHKFFGMEYVVSEDGVHWDKPNLGLVSAPAAVDHKKHFPFPTPAGTSCDNNLGVPFTVVADLGQNGNVADPSKRFALRLMPDPSKPSDIGASWRHAPRGYFAAELPDFLNDPDWREKLIDSGGDFDPRRKTLTFWDDIHEEWVAMEQGVIGHWLPSRDVARFASKDLINWTSQAVLYPDAADVSLPHCYDEAHALVAFCRDGVVLGLLDWFRSDRSHPHGGPDLSDTTQPAHNCGNLPVCLKATCECRITISRDGGVTWDRAASREAWIPHGTEQDSYNRLVIGVRAPLRVGDEDWFYAGVINGDHMGVRNDQGTTSYYHDRLRRAEVALFVQKHNRYVSLTARNEEEVLITKPVLVDGDTLQLNVDGSRGEVRVGIASSEPIICLGAPSTAEYLLYSVCKPNFNGQLAGYSFDDCKPVYENSIEHTVQFTNGSNLAALRGQTVRLLFKMQDADLYGFRFC